MKFCAGVTPMLESGRPSSHLILGVGMEREDTLTIPGSRLLDRATADVMFWSHSKFSDYYIDTWQMFQKHGTFKDQCINFINITFILMAFLTIISKVSFLYFRRLCRGFHLPIEKKKTTPPNQMKSKKKSFNFWPISNKTTMPKLWNNMSSWPDSNISDLNKLLESLWEHKLYLYYRNLFFPGSRCMPKLWQNVHNIILHFSEWFFFSHGKDSS